MLAMVSDEQYSRNSIIGQADICSHLYLHPTYSNSPPSLWDNLLFGSVGARKGSSDASKPPLPSFATKVDAFHVSTPHHTDLLGVC